MVYRIRMMAGSACVGFVGLVRRILPASPSDNVLVAPSVATVSMLVLGCPVTSNTQVSSSWR